MTGIHKYLIVKANKMSTTTIELEKALIAIEIIKKPSTKINPKKTYKLGVRKDMVFKKLYSKYFGKTAKKLIFNSRKSSKSCQAPSSNFQKNNDQNKLDIKCYSCNKTKHISKNCRASPNATNNKLEN